MCFRSIDRLVDDSRYTPDKCTITLRCDGRLLPVEYTSNARAIPTALTGVQDWRQRGTALTTETSIAPVEFLNTSTGKLGQLVLAAPIDAPTIIVSLLQRADTPRAYKQFVFRLTGVFSTISGVESGIEKKTLRYDITDEVQVFLNGVQLESGAAPENFSRYDGLGTNGVPPNTLKFNTQITLAGTTQVDVIVKPALQTTTATITLSRITDQNASRLDSGAYERVSKVLALRASDGAFVPLYLYSIDLSNISLALNNLFTVQSTTGGALTSVLMLLAKPQYSTVDRYSTIVVRLSDLSLERDYLRYVNLSGTPTLQITRTSISSVYPPLRFVLHNSLTREVLTTAVSGSGDALTVDGSVITGPDA